MKFPSLVKLPKYNKFNFEPRYYDPVKEEIEMRTKNMKAELDAHKRLDPNDRARFRSEMEQVFKRRAAEDRNSNVMQVTFIFLFLSIFVGYLFYGNYALYAALILIPMYILYRKRAFTSKKE